MPPATAGPPPTTTRPPSRAHTVRFALIGNPNTGRTTLFNRLCGVRATTANFPGTTSELRIGRCVRGSRRYQIADLPGTYGLRLDMPESRLCRAYLDNGLGRDDARAALLIVVDAANLARNLVLAGEALARRVPTVVALNMIDIARRQGLAIDVEALARATGCPVIPVCARTGEGVDHLIAALACPTASTAPLSRSDARQDLIAWAQQTVDLCTAQEERATARADTLTDRLDAVLTHPVMGLAVFAAVMTGLFMSIFSLATLPMDLIQLIFSRLGQWLEALIPAGPLQGLLVDGVVGGVAGTVVFLPQICLLFFLISLLEDSGYLARAAFVADRGLRRFGLPGQAFVPLLSAHACAIPAIMSARLIPDPRDRLATILVAPFMSCSARLPVYVLVIGLLFPHNPLAAGLAFAGCYAAGAVAALLTASLFRRTVVRGQSRPMMLELPTYKLPSLRTALLTTFDRSVVFLRNAGTIILGICVVLWWLSAYPVSDPPPEALELRAAARALADEDPARAAELEAEAAGAESRHALARSFVGRIGHAAEPAFRPLGYDWQLSIGVLTSFAAREVFVSTMAVICAASDETDDTNVIERIKTATRDDGSPIFTTSTSASLLVFYVLAMQCLPTLAVTRREAGGWRWAALQFGYMSILAYLAALGTRLGLQMMGVT